MPGRNRLIGEVASRVQQMLHLLECVWPATLETANWPFRPKTWRQRCGSSWTATAATSPRTRRLGPALFEQQVRLEITRRDGQRPCLRIARTLFTALAVPTGTDDGRGTDHMLDANRLALICGWLLRSDELVDRSFRGRSSA